ncbi:MAG: hypothetical protein K2X66_08870 [Cyanobacteria bacterium]|nr:hypothetical protein [Cyanobacteriota bacterium]
MERIWHCGGARRTTSYRLLSSLENVLYQWLRVLTQCPVCKKKVLEFVNQYESGEMGAARRIPQRLHLEWLGRIQTDLFAPEIQIIGDYTHLISGDTARVYQQVLKRNQCFRT